jgi:hypothetical protein
MTTNQSLIIRRGNASLDLNTAPYAIGADFVPPAVSANAQIADGSSANIYGGGVRSSVKYADRAWAFEVRISGTTDTQIKQATRRLAQFLGNLSDQTPTYLEYRTNTDTPAPFYGQYGAALRYEVINATVEMWDTYGLQFTRQLAAIVTVNATIKPFALGKQQVIGTATGGIIEDLTGSADSTSRGLIVAEATTNKMTNPVFGNATWNNNWSAGSSLTAAQNTDTAFLLPDTSNSARLTSAAATNNTYTQSINVANTNKHSISALVRLPDGGAVSATQCQLYYGAALTTVYTALGNGWYRLTSDNFNGVASARATGLIVANGYTVYLAGCQIEEKTYSTPLTYGDQLGCTWTSTAHASTSTRTAASWKRATTDILPFGAWSVRVVLRTWFTSTPPASWFVFDARDGSHTTAPFLYYDLGGAFILFYNGQYSIVYPTFSAGAIYVLHAVCDGTHVTLYTNGVAASASAAFSATAFGANLFIGSAYDTSTLGNQTTLGFATFDQALTATQVTNDYANISAAIADGSRLECVPWLWTKDGDAVVDNCLDTTGSTGAPHDNFCVVGGVAGSVPADTTIYGTIYSNFATIETVWISLLSDKTFIKPGSYLFSNIGGTSGAASDCGGDYYQTSLATGGLSLIGNYDTSDVRVMRVLAGRELYLFSRIYDAGSGLVLAGYIALGGSTIISPSRTVSSGASSRLFRTDSVTVPVVNRLVDVAGLKLVNFTVQLYGDRVAGSTTNNVAVDYMAIMPRPLVAISSNSTYQSFVINAVNGLITNTTTVGNLPGSIIGDVIALEPDRYNVLQSLMSAEGTATTVTDTLTYNAVYITPRWALL